MRKIIEIPEAYKLYRIFDKICFNKFVTGDQRINLSYFDGTQVQLIERGNFYVGKQVGNSYMWQPREGLGLKIWDKNFNVVNEVSWEIYFGSRQLLENKLIATIVENDISTTRLYSEDLSYTTTLNRLIVARGGGVFISSKNNKQAIEAYGILDNEIKWEMDFSGFTGGGHPVNPNKSRKPNEVQVPYGPGGNDDTVFIPLSYGQLVALNASDGQIQWIIDLTGSSICYGNQLYNLNGPELIELDIKTGAVVKTLEFGKYIDKKGLLMSAPFKVYEDFILVQGLDSIVALVDRKNLTLTDWIQLDSKEPPRIASNETVMHWCNDHLYVVDMNEKLHIYSR